MSKNLTRKGLALGAVIALGSSLFAGSPATAAPTAISLASSFGTSNSALLGSYFNIAALAKNGATDDELKYYVEGATAANLEAYGRDVSKLTSDSTVSTYVSRAVSVVDNAAKTAVISSPNVRAKYSQLAIKLTGITATTSIKVTAFVDSELDDGMPGAGEIASAPLTITFNKLTEITATPTIKAISAGSDVKATVALSPAVNLEQLRGIADGAYEAAEVIEVSFPQNGASASPGDDDFAVWNTTDKEFVANSGDTATVGVTYGATAYVNDVASGSAAAAAATAGEVTSLGAVSVSRGSNYNGSHLRAGSGKFKISSEVTGVSADKKTSGQKVTFKILEDALLAAGATVTAGGKTLTASADTDAQSISVEVVSDADGVASLEVSYAGIEDANSLELSATAAPSTGSTLVSSGTVTVVAQDSAAEKLVDAVESANADAVRRIAKGGAISVPVVLVDQFGQTPSGTFRAVVTSSAGSSFGTPSIASPVDLVGGKVTVSGTDNSTAAQTVTVTIDIYKKNTDGTWPAVGSPLESTVAEYSVGAAVETIGRLEASQANTTGVDRAGIDFVAGNEDLAQGSVSFEEPGGNATITTTAYATTGAPAPGASVTLSAPGLLFHTGAIWSVDSITVVADDQGATPAVYVYSNKAGKQTVTISSGGVTTTKTITYNAATTGGKTWKITAPKYVLPGQTLKVSAVLVDKFGSPVETAADGIKVVYTGAGFVTTAIADKTDSDGVVSFTVLLGAADSGTATVKFTYGGADLIAAATTTDDVVATETITIGAAPVAAATAAVAGSTGKFFVSATAAAGKSVVVKVAGKFVTSFKATGSKKSVAVKATKGKKKVTVFVGGKLVATKTVTVK